VEPTGIGIIGCGNVSTTYMETLGRFDHLRVVACTDLDQQRARALAARYRIQAAATPDDLLADPTIEVVMNLTVPAAHGPVGLAALQAGKSVYNEKPLALHREEGRRMQEAADSNGLRLGAAPDTFMGDALQVARAAIDAGLAGEIVGVTAFSTRRGPENWHPNPGFFYQPGAGPLFDLGPYYVSVLVALLGPIRRVSASARISFPERRITAGPNAGTSIPAETPTNVAAVLDFASGPVGMLLTSFDVAASELPFMEVHGAEATLSLPDPTNYGGAVRLRRLDEEDWTELYSAPVHDDYRGTGAVEMVEAIRAGRPHRASGPFGYHVLDVLLGVLESSEAGRAIELESSCERPEPLEAGAQLLGAPA
jgi:predicted dehydrogenase